VLVPNTNLSDSAVTNFSQAPHRRIFWRIGVEYRTTTDQLRQIRDAIDDYVRETEAFAPQGEVNNYVRIDSFGPSSIDILVSCYTRTTVWAEMLEVKEQLAYRVMDIIAEAGTGFAFPSQSLYVESLPGATPDIFNPPAPGAAASPPKEPEEQNS